MIKLSTNKYFIERSVQFEEQHLLAVEVGESSSPPDPLIVSEETNEFDDSDMSNNDDLISDPNSITRPKWESNTIHAVARVFTLACANEHLLRNLESLVAVQ